MFLEILLAVVLGICFGVFSGLIPGIHVNLISAIVVGSVGLLSGVQPFLIVLFIISLALTHSFLDSIPTVYLGAPDPNMVVGVLPAHQLFLEGKGHVAVLLTLCGSFFSLVFSLVLAPLVYVVLTPLSGLLSAYIGKILLGLVLLLFLLSKKFVNVIFFLLAGLLGFISFELSLEQVLLPLLSGLFGVSTLLLSLCSQSIVKKQRVKKKQFIATYDAIERNGLLATITGFFASFLPGFGSSQGAIFASQAIKEKTPANYLLLVGGINTVNFTLSLLTLIVLSKARNGAVASFSSIFSLEVIHLWYILAVILIVGGIAVMLGIFISGQFAKIINKIPYKKVIVIVIGCIVLLVLIMTQLRGLILLFTATSLGILAQKYGAQKNMLLGCLLLPVMVYLW